VITIATGADYDTAAATLTNARGNVKTAIVMLNGKYFVRASAPRIGEIKRLCYIGSQTIRGEKTTPIKFRMAKFLKLILTSIRRSWASPKRDCNFFRRSRKITNRPWFNKQQVGYEIT